MVYKLVPLLALLLATAHAQEAAVPGLPAEWQPLATVAIALASSLLVGPLTAIAKKLGRTSGPTTVAISAVLSLAVALVFTGWQAAASNTALPWGTAVVMAVLGFLKANGDYISRVFAVGKALDSAPVPPPQPAAPAYLPPAVAFDDTALGVGSELQPPAELKGPPPSGLEPLPGARSLLGAGLVGASVAEMGLSALISEVLQSAGLDVTPERLVRVAARLAVQVAPELLDGDPHLSAQARNAVLGVVLDMKQGGAL